MRLVEADQLPLAHAPSIRAARGERGGEVEHRQRHPLLQLPVLAVDREVGQGQAGHRDDGQHRLVLADPPRGTAEEEPGQRGVPHVVERLGQLRALVAELAERRDQLVQDVVSSGSTWRAARCSRIGVDRSFATCGGSSIMQMSWASAFRSARAAATALRHSAAPGSPWG